MVKTAPCGRHTGGPSLTSSSNCRYVGLLRLMLVSQTCERGVGGGGAGRELHLVCRRGAPAAARIVQCAHLVVVQRQPRLVARHLAHADADVAVLAAARARGEEGGAGWQQQQRAVGRRLAARLKGRRARASGRVSDAPAERDRAFDRHRVAVGAIF